MLSTATTLNQSIIGSVELMGRPSNSFSSSDFVPAQSILHKQSKESFKNKSDQVWYIICIILNCIVCWCLQDVWMIF